MSSLRHKILSVTDSTFEETALEVFAFQYENVKVYRQYCDSLKQNPANVKSVAQIPFLPVEFFKTHGIIADGKTSAKTFESSGTTGQISSKHQVADLSLYEDSFLKCFQQFYGDINQYVVIALLPSYLERNNSSLVYMAKDLIERSGQNASGFFLNEFDKLYDWLDVLKTSKRKVILLGVTFALLDFAAQYKIDFPDLIVMETGGMKGRREELTREEVHLQLKNSFGVKQIHSEYGMTELLSQAYSKGDGVFQLPPWLKIFTRDMYDPLRLQEENKIGVINVIDLANLYSCSFIATGDLGKVNFNGTFEVLGRMADTEVRGCNLMVV
ncbi:MAG: acyl transferase [Bacteroidetes bacterium]|nr:acyl transferase [Bacteroidota bacterium]